ncbi:MAG: hypothetical protein ACK4ZW_08435 [Blastomonas sp.]
MSVFIDDGEKGTWARQLAYRSLPCQQNTIPDGRTKGAQPDLNDGARVGGGATVSAPPATHSAIS